MSAHAIVHAERSRLALALYAKVAPTQLSYLLLSEYSYPCPKHFVENSVTP